MVDFNNDFMREAVERLAKCRAFGMMAADEQPGEPVENVAKADIVRACMYSRDEVKDVRELVLAWERDDAVLFGGAK